MRMKAAAAAAAAAGSLAVIYEPVRNTFAVI